MKYIHATSLNYVWVKAQRPDDWPSEEPFVSNSIYCYLQGVKVASITNDKDGTCVMQYSPFISDNFFTYSLEEMKKEVEKRVAKELEKQYNANNLLDKLGIKP